MLSKLADVYGRTRIRNVSLVSALHSVIRVTSLHRSFLFMLFRCLLFAEELWRYKNLISRELSLLNQLLLVVKVGMVPYLLIESAVKMTSCLFSL